MGETLNREFAELRNKVFTNPTLSEIDDAFEKIKHAAQTAQRERDAEICQEFMIKTDPDNPTIRNTASWCRDAILADTGEDAG